MIFVVETNFFYIKYEQIVVSIDLVEMISENLTETNTFLHTLCVRNSINKEHVFALTHDECTW